MQRILDPPFATRDRSQIPSDRMKTSARAASLNNSRDLFVRLICLTDECAMHYDEDSLTISQFIIDEHGPRARIDGRSSKTS